MHEIRATVPTELTEEAARLTHEAGIEREVFIHGPGLVRQMVSADTQDHRRAKHRLGPMLGLKSFQTAAIVIGGIELAEKIKKGQFKVGKLGGTRANMTEIWRAALSE